MRRLSITVSPKLLANILNLPPGVEVVDARYDNWRRQIKLLLQSPEFAEVNEGDQLPQATPQFETITSRAARFVGWNIKKETK